MREFSRELALRIYHAGYQAGGEDKDNFSFDFVPTELEAETWHGEALDILTRDYFQSPELPSNEEGIVLSRPLEL